MNILTIFLPHLFLNIRVYDEVLSFPFLIINRFSRSIGSTEETREGTSSIEELKRIPEEHTCDIYSHLIK